MSVPVMPPQETLDHVPPDFRQVDLSLLVGLAPYDAPRRKSYGYIPPLTIERWWNGHPHYPHYIGNNTTARYGANCLAVISWLRVQGTLPIRSFLASPVTAALAAFRATVREHEASDELDFLDAILDRAVVRVLADHRMTIAAFNAALREWLRWRTRTKHETIPERPLTLAGEFTTAFPSHPRDTRIARATYGWESATACKLSDMTPEFGVTRERIRMLRFRLESTVRNGQIPLLPTAMLAYDILQRHGGLLSIHWWLAGLPRPFQAYGPWQLRVVRELSAWGALPELSWIEVDGTEYAIAGWHKPEVLFAQIEVERAALRRRTGGLAVRIPDLRTVPTSLAEQLVRHDPAWVAIGNGWYRPRSLRNNPGLAEVQRMLTTLGALRLEVLTAALCNMVVDPGTGERFTVPPERILRTLLLERGFAIDDRDTVSLGTVPPLRHPDGTIWRLLRIMRRHDISISRDDLVLLAGERGLSPEAVDAFLARGILVHEDLPGRYLPWGDGDRRTANSGSMDDG